MRLFTIWLLLFVLNGVVLAEPVVDGETTNTPTESAISENTSLEQIETPAVTTLQKAVELQYSKKPQKVFKGEMFSVTIKATHLVQGITDTSFELLGAIGVKAITKIPKKEMTSDGINYTFYFAATSPEVKLPDFKVTLSTQDGTQYENSTLVGESIATVSLAPRDDFSNIIANSFEILQYKTTSFDDTHNIVVFVAKALNSDIASFKLKDVFKQGIESIKESYSDSKITYYVVIDKEIQNLTFSYFNLEKNGFVPVAIPIVVNDDSVVTQTDLTPTEQSHEILKTLIATIITIGGFFLIVWRKKYKLLVLLLIPIVYIVYAKSPSKEICVKKNSNIYLIPLRNGTVFEVIPEKENLQKDDEIDGWSKIQLKNKKIGWVRDEDTCKN